MMSSTVLTAVTHSPRRRNFVPDSDDAPPRFAHAALSAWAEEVEERQKRHNPQAGTLGITAFGRVDHATRSREREYLSSNSLHVRGGCERQGAFPLHWPRQDRDHA